MTPLFTITLVALALGAQAQTKKEAKEAELNQARYAAWDCESITDTAMRMRCILGKVDHDRAEQQMAWAKRDSVAKAYRDSVHAARPKMKLVEPEPKEELPEPTFYSAYGTGYVGLANIESMRIRGNRFLTPFTYVDFNYVYERVDAFMRYNLQITEVGDGPTVGTDRIVSKYKGSQGTITISYSVGTYENFYYIKSVRITGSSFYINRFFLWYWPHNFNEGAVKTGELLAYTYLLDRVAYVPGSSPVITIENPSIKNHQDFVNRLSK